MGRIPDAERALIDLVESSHFATADDLPGIATSACAAIGAHQAALYLVDYDQQVLVPLGSSDEPLVIDGTLAGRAYRLVEVQQSRGDDGETRVWIPLLDGTERLGVLTATVSEADDALITRLRAFASVLAQLVVAKRYYGDLIEQVSRTRRMSVSAEVAWRVVPPLTYANESVVIAAALAPSYELGGDVFDYAVDRRTADVAIFDAMGHGLRASLLATVALAAYRNVRRSGAELEEIVRFVDATLLEEFGGDRFVTAIIGQLDLATGVFRRVRAGHPKSVLIRETRTARVLDCPATLPLGIGLDEVHVCDEQLQPGDRLLLYTDGVIEARDDSGDFFGPERLADALVRESSSGAPAPEVLRRLRQGIFERHGHTLSDDATLVMVEWRSGDEQRLLM